MLYVITGPPASGKSTYVKQHAQHGDITIDYDALANTLTIPDPNKPHDHPNHITQIVRAARQAAIDQAIKHATETDVYVIHSTPSTQLLDNYRRRGAKIIVIDPGQDVVLARCKAERPWRMQAAVKKWYERHDNDDDTHTEQPQPLPPEETPTDTPQRRAGGISPYAGRSTRRYKALRTKFRAHCQDNNEPCWLCGKPIDHELPRQHAESFNVDHAYTVDERPDLAEDLANFRPAHKLCNERRGTAEPTIQLGDTSEAW